MIINYSNTKYRITYDGFSFVENALGNPNLVQIAIASGTTIQLAPDEFFGIDYRKNGEYASWRLSAINTRLVRAEKHYIYARLSRTDDQALIVFSVNHYRMDGLILNAGQTPTAETPSAEEQPLQDGPYYYVEIGSITATNSVDQPTTLREIKIDGGYLTTPQGSGSVEQMFRIIAGNLIQPLKRMASHTVEGTLEILGGLKSRGKVKLNGKEFDDIARQQDVPAKPIKPEKPAPPPTPEEIEEEKKQEDKTLPTVGYMKGEFSEFLGKKFLRKDKEDETQFLIRFLGELGKGGVEVGEFIEGMLAGKGTKLFTNGRIQTDRLEVRGSMTVMDLLINEIHAMAGEFNFSDCGKIDKVDFVGENTYKITLHKDSETDVTNLDENDVLYSIVNNLRLGGKDYYTSWFRVLSKNVSENSLTVLLFPDSEVPGGDTDPNTGDSVRKNYPPVAGYNVTRRGNVVVPAKGEVNERSQSWLMSSREGRIMFLQNVYKPILESYNYALTLGKLPNLKVIDELGLTNDVGLYAETIVTEKLYQIDWNGDVIPRKVDRGEWSLEVAQSNKPYRYVQNEKEYPDGKHYTELEQHTVYHYGCKWGCLIDLTTEEPMWNSAAWVMLEGDKEYHLDFDSTGGWQFHVSNVNTIITAVVRYGNRDITKLLFADPYTQIEWFRVTGNTASDNSWKPNFVDGHKNKIQLTRRDMGGGWGYDYKKVSFICKIFIPVGDKLEKVENSININL